MNQVVQAHNLKSQAVWNSAGGRYDEISRSIADAIEHAVERLRPEAGDRILDLATGTGWGSRAIARRSPAIKVTGADIADAMLDHARREAAKEGLAIEYRQADAESLPFADQSFDGVLSTFGVMFVGRPEAAAAELARVIRPGGRVVLATWKHDGNIFEMFGVLKKFMPPPPQPPPPSPFAWGKQERLRELLGASFDLEFEEGASVYRYADGKQAWNLFVQHYGPCKTLASNLDDARRLELERDFTAWHETFKGALGYEQPRQYVITRGRRR
jgi:SAM-dependent methyltransferase